MNALTSDFVPDALVEDRYVTFAILFPRREPLLIRSAVVIRRACGK
jgi:hypothetical protein